jgi:hypothetical protein
MTVTVGVLSFVGQYGTQTLDQFDRSAQVLDQWHAQTQPAYMWS